MLKGLFGLMGGLLLSFGLWLHDKELTSRRYERVWWVLDALIILLVVGFCASCKATSVVKYEPVPVVLTDSLEMMGKTVCDVNVNKPVVFVRRSLRGVGMSEVVYHEMVHAKQALEYGGGCNAILRRYSQDRIFAYEIEAQAYCETIQAMLPNREWTRAKETLRERLFRSMSGVSKTQGDAIVNRFCRNTAYEVRPDGTITQPP